MRTRTLPTPATTTPLAWNLFTPAPSPGEGGGAWALPASRHPAHTAPDNTHMGRRWCCGGYTRSMLRGALGSQRALKRLLLGCRAQPAPSSPAAQSSSTATHGGVSMAAVQTAQTQLGPKSRTAAARNEHICRCAENGKETWGWDGVFAADSRHPPRCRQTSSTQACGPSTLSRRAPSISATSGHKDPRRPAHSHRCPMCAPPLPPSPFPFPFPTVCLVCHPRSSRGSVYSRVALGS